MKNEYMVKFWGACLNDGWLWAQMPELNGSKYQWFDTAEERTAFIEKLRTVVASGGPAYNVVVIDTREGDDTRIRSVAVCTMVMPDGRRFAITEDFGYGRLDSTEEHIHFDFEENNRSCDHRRQDMIARRYPEYEARDEFDTCNSTIKVEGLCVLLASEYITVEEQAELALEGRYVIALLPEAFHPLDGIVDFSKSRASMFQSIADINIAALYEASSKRQH